MATIPENPQEYCMRLYNTAIAGKQQLEAGALLHAITQLTGSASTSEQLNKIVSIFKRASEQQPSEHAKELSELGHTLSSMGEIQAMSTTTRATIKIATQTFARRAAAVAPEGSDNPLTTDLWERISIWRIAFVETVRMWLNDFPLELREKIVNILTQIEMNPYSTLKQNEEVLKKILSMFEESKPLSEPLRVMEEKTKKLLDDIQQSTPTSTAKLPSPEELSPPDEPALKHPPELNVEEDQPLPQDVIEAALANWDLQEPAAAPKPKPAEPPTADPALLISSERVRLLGMLQKTIPKADLSADDLLYMLAYTPLEKPPEAYRNRIKLVCQKLLPYLDTEGKEYVLSMLRGILKKNDGQNKILTKWIQIYFPATKGSDF